MKSVNSDKQDLIDGIEWLKVVLAIVVIVPLSLLYVFWQPPQNNMLGQLVINSIPSAIVVLIAIPVVYFVFRGRRLDIAQGVDPENLAASIARRLSEERTTDAIIAFHDTYRKVDWSAWITSANSQIDIVVYYFDSWVNQHYEALKAFFQKPGTHMRVILSDPYSDGILANINVLFPESSRERLREKIVKTGERLSAVLRDAGASPSRLEVYYAPRLLSYSGQSRDNEVLVLSVFEMYRQNRIDSPAIVFDLTKSRALSQFWHKEFDGLRGESERQRPLG